MTTARLKHRDYVPYGWIAIEFCDIEFFGDNSSLYTKKWEDIKYKKYHECKSKIDALSTRRRLIERQRNSILSELSGLQEEKPWWKIWKTDYEKELIKKVFRMDSDIEIIEVDIERVKDDQFYDITTLVRKAERMLNENGFILKSSNASGTECITHTDIWELGVIK